MEHTKKNTGFKDSTLIIVASLLAAILVVMTFGYVTRSTASADEYIAQAEQHLSTTNYNITQAIEYYERAVEAEPNNKIALYALARAYYISGNFDASFRAISVYRNAYPEDARIDYIAGLANAYAGYYDASLASFDAFIESGLATWPAYLDVAWVHFKTGEYESARDNLEYAIEVYGSNAWLATSLGGVYVALEEYDQAQEQLLVASSHMDLLTHDEWRANYSMNNPNNVSAEMAQMAKVIAFNQALAQEGTGAVSQAEIIDLLNVPFADTSHLGIGKGLVVSACGNSCTNTQCISAANVCGQVSTGTQSSCGGGCSANVPANPSGTCSVATECGVNATGYNGCNGQCNITRYPFCTTTENPDGDGVIEWIDIDSNGPNGEFGPTDIACEIFAAPSLVNPGGQTVIRWLSTETDTATVTANTNGDSWEGRFGEEISSFILQQTTYTLSCVGYDGSIVTDSVTVEIVPMWEEF